MFSKENRRFTILAIALVVVVMGTLSGVSKAVAGDHANNAYLISGVSAMVVLQLLSMMRQEQGRHETRETQQKIVDKVTEAKDTVDNLERKTNGNLTNAIQQVAEEVKKAKDEPAPGQEQMPRTPAELQSLIKMFVHEISEEAIRTASQKAAVDATKAAVDVATRTTTDTVISQLTQSGYEIVKQKNGDAPS